MKREIIAVLVQQTGIFLSELMKNRSYFKSSISKNRDISLPVSSPIVIDESSEESEENYNKSTSIASGCIPCSLGHVGTCSGLLNESIRFAKSEEGIASPEVIERVNMCLDELNTMERVDLRPEMIVNLPSDDKVLAEKALSISRATRHKLEGISSFNDLEEAAATIQSARNEIGKEWFSQRLTNISKEEKIKIDEQTIEKLKEDN